MTELKFDPSELPVFRPPELELRAPGFPVFRGPDLTLYQEVPDVELTLPNYIGQALIHKFRFDEEKPSIQSAIGWVARDFWNSARAFAKGVNASLWGMTELVEDYSQGVAEWHNSWSGKLGGDVPYHVPILMALTSFSPEVAWTTKKIGNYLQSWLEVSTESLGEVNSDSLANKAIEFAGQALPTVLIAGPVAAEAQALAVSAKVGPAGQAVTRVAAMASLGGALGGLEGSADFAGLEMLNLSLAPFPRYIRAPVLGYFMGKTAQLRGESDDDQLAAGMLGFMFGAAGQRGDINTLNLKRPLLRWAAKTPKEAEFRLTPELEAQIESNATSYLRDFYPDIAQSIQLSRQKGRWPDPDKPPTQQLAIRLESITGREAKVTDQQGMAREVATALTMTRAKLLQEAPEGSLPMTGAEIGRVSESLADAAFRADRLWAQGARKPVEFPELPLGQRRKVPTEAQLEARRPQQFVGEGGEPLLGTRKQVVETIVKLPGGEELSVPIELGAKANKVIAAHEAATESLRTQKRPINQRFIDRLRGLREWSYENFVGSEGKLRRYLEETGGVVGEEAMLLRGTVRNSSTAASVKIEDATRRIFRGLSRGDRENLSVLIDALHNIEIAERRPRFRFERGLKKGDYESAADVILNKLEPAKADLLRERADFYFEEWVNMLDHLKRHKVIGESDFNNMMNLRYSPRRFLLELEKTIGRDEFFAAEKFQVTETGLKELSERGTEELTVRDPMMLLRYGIARAEMRAWKNDAMRALARYATEVENPHIRIPELTKAGNAKIPEGYEILEYREGGKAESLLVSQEMARMWEETPLAARKVHAALKFGFGTALIRPLATTYNPSFALGSLSRDFVFTLLADRTGLGYSEFLPKAVFEMGRNLTVNFRDIVSHGREYRSIFSLKSLQTPLGGPREGSAVRAFHEEAGGFGSILSRQVIEDFHTGSQVESLTKGAKTNFKKGLMTAHQVFSYMSSTAELAMRVSYRDQLIRNGMEPRTASLHAVDILNFARTAPVMRFVNDVVPFSNATMQAMDGLAKAAKKDPGRFSSLVAQLAVADGLMNVYNILTNPDGWSQVSDYDKIHNYIIMMPPELYEVDESGNARYFYAKIRKETSPVTTPVTASVTALLDKVFFNQAPSPFMLTAIAQSLPYGQELMFPPSAEFVAALNNVNLRFFDKIYKGSPVDPPLEYDQNTPDVWKTAGSMLNLSPKRLQVATKKIVPNTFVTGFAELLLKEAEPTTRDALRLSMLTEIPVIRRFFSQTNPFERDYMRMEEISREGNTERKLLIDDPLEQKLLAVRRGKGTHRDVEKWALTDENIDRSQGVRIVDRIRRHEEIWRVWDRLREKHTQIELERIPSPWWWRTLASRRPEERAKAYFEKWWELPPKKKEIMRRLEAFTPGFANSLEYRNVFARYRKDRGDGWVVDD